MMLAQLMNLPVKLLLSEPIEIAKKYKGKLDDEEQKKLYIQEKFNVLHKFDKQLKDIKIPKILLERLKKEFDDSNRLSTQFGKPNTYQGKYD